MTIQRDNVMRHIVSDRTHSPQQNRLQIAISQRIRVDGDKVNNGICGLSMYRQWHKIKQIVQKQEKPRLAVFVMDFH